MTTNVIPRYIRVITRRFVLALATMACSADGIPAPGLTETAARAHYEDPDQVYCADDPAYCPGGIYWGGEPSEGDFRTDPDPSQGEPDPEGYVLSPISEYTKVDGWTRVRITHTGAQYFLPHVMTLRTATRVVAGSGYAYLDVTGQYEKGTSVTDVNVHRRNYGSAWWSLDVESYCGDRPLFAELTSQHMGRFYTHRLGPFPTMSSAECTFNQSQGGGGETPPKIGCVFLGYIEVSRNGGITWERISEVWECPDEDEV